MYKKSLMISHIYLNNFTYSKTFPAQYVYSQGQDNSTLASDFG